MSASQAYPPMFIEVKEFIRATSSYQKCICNHKLLNILRKKYTMPFKITFKLKEIDAA